MDADMAFNSSSVVLVVVGRGPLGAFTAKVSAVQMEGTSGWGQLQLACLASDTPIESVHTVVKASCTYMLSAEM